MERARERAGRVVPDHDLHLVAALAERLGLELGVLEHCPPEAPRERDDDADLHEAESMARVMLVSCSRKDSPSCTPISVGPWPRRSSGRSRTSRASRSR